MSYSDRVHSLITYLMAATRFEDAARATLVAMLACADEARGASSYGSRGRLLRAMVHLRPEDGYRRLFGVEHPSHKPAEGIGYLTSATVWRWVSEHGCSVSLDVELGTLQPWLEGAPAALQARVRDTQLTGQETRERMLGRNATHVHVVPLRLPAGRIDGMISLEASCKAAIGQEFVWSECHEELEVLAAAAMPYLDALPSDAITPASVPKDELLPVVGKATASLIEIVRVFVDQEETLLISGPTGAGKSRLARWCHDQSRRKPHPFETLDLLSVPEDLQMAELVGWKRGAFTGATSSMPGALTRAAKGTLFIDEIDKLSLKAQAGLLRVLEERRYRALGDDTNERQAEARFIIGTNADLRAAVRNGRFREDLYYRIHVLPVRLPPLGERLDEVPGWAVFMLERCSGRSRGDVRLAADAIQALLSHPWPGNLRQLDNVIRRTYAFALAGRGAAEGQLLVEKRHVERALAFEDAGDSNTVTERVWRAAQALAREAMRRKQQENAEPLTLEMVDGVRGMVLGAAVQFLDSREQAFELFQRKHLLTGRNHHRALKRELERTIQLVHALGGEVADPDLSALIENAEPARGVE
jgi:transcriptional regulator with AAA-type ATPase domain